MFFGVLMGVFLIALGLSIILKTFFNIDIPVVKPIIASTLILLGTDILIKALFYKQFFIAFNY